jgi:flavin reductase (DIM6/NTAB) family NADH-FMN oxidoreductase RutF
VSPAGDANLAPYSFFNAVADKPAYVMFSSSGRKDSLKNIEATGEFVCSLATWDLREGVNLSSASLPYGQSEFPLSGLTAAPSQFVKPPRVAESPAALECRHFNTMELPRGDSEPNYLIVGLVVGIYIDERYIRNGMVDTAAMQPIARMGYREYAVVRPEVVFEMDRPQVKKGD